MNRAGLLLAVAALLHAACDSNDPGWDVPMDGPDVSGDTGADGVWDVPVDTPDAETLARIIHEGP